MLLFAWKQHGRRKKKGGMEKGRKKSGISSIGDNMKTKTRIRMLIAFIAVACMLPVKALPAQASGLSVQAQAVSARASAAARNGIQTVNGKKYYYRNGQKKTGKIQVGKNWYYFGPEMKFGLFRDEKGTVYYAGKNGVLQRGFHTIGGKRYYFNSNTASIRYEGHEGLLNVNGRFYICRGGAVLTGLISYGGKTYLAGPDGILKTGWQNVNGSPAYFWKKAGNGHVRFERAKGTAVISGVTHYLDTSGVPLKSYGGKALDRYGVMTTAPVTPTPAPSPAPAPAPVPTPAPSPSAPDARFFGDVSAGKTLTQKAILSCLNYYESELQKLNSKNKFEERFGKKGAPSGDVWQYSNHGALGSYFARFDKMNSGAYSKNGRTVRYCNCDTCKWWVVQDVLNVNGTTSRDINTVWKKYKVNSLKLRDLIAKGGFKSGGKFIELTPGTCFYNTGMTHTWIYMGQGSDGTERVFDTGHGGNISAYAPSLKEKVRAWEKDLSNRYHTDGKRAVFRTWINEASDTWEYGGQNIGTIWIPNDLKTFYYWNAAGKLVKN